MSESENHFLAKIDELISLFKRLQEKAKKEGILSEGDPMYENFEMLANNYEMMKSSIPPGMVGEMAEPIKEIVSQMVNQLKDDLGLDEDITESELVAKSTTSELESIDKQLKAGNLSEDEINGLLDRRSKLE